jgi:diaminopimelate decarboxylase
VAAILRLNPGGYPRQAGLAMGGLPAQFGADVAWVRRDPAAFAADGVDMIGYHVYVGTNASTVVDLAGWFDLALAAVAAAQEELALPLHLVDLGGGFGHPYARPGGRPDLAGLAAPTTDLLDSRLPGWRDGMPGIAFESGRYLVAGAGSLVLGVQDVKVSQGVRFVVADGGINALGGMGGLRRVPPVLAGALDHGLPSPATGEPEPDIPSDPPADAGLPTRLTGPLCTALDVLHPNLPATPARPGSLLVVPNTGAYGLTASLLGFLSRDAPTEVAFDGSRLVSATRLHLSYQPAVPATPDVSAASAPVISPRPPSPAEMGLR